MLPSHSHADASLIRQAKALGCLPPNFCRDVHPGFWEWWEARALAVINLKLTPGHASRVAEADAFCGQPPARRGLTLQDLAIGCAGQHAPAIMFA